MTRDGLPRAYLRIDPNIDQHPDPLSMLRAMCAAARQPKRGRFRDALVLERAVGRRPYRAMVERGDVVPAEPGPGVYLAGWDEWQEGDFTVAERMRRMRDRRSNGVTLPLPRRNGVTTDAGSSTDDVVDNGVGVGVEPPNPPPGGGRRSNATNPRAIAAAEREAERELAHRRRLEATQQHIASLKGAR
jgi:hypothetical protein